EMDGTKHCFDRKGRLFLLEDRFGNKIDLTYEDYNHDGTNDYDYNGDGTSDHTQDLDHDGTQESTAPLGVVNEVTSVRERGTARRLDFNYDSTMRDGLLEWRLTSIKDHAERVVKFDQDSSGNLRSVTSPPPYASGATDHPDDQLILHGRRTVYKYIPPAGMATEQRNLTAILSPVDADSTVDGERFIRI